MIKELEMKSTEDENRVRDMNVTVENLTMNLSMNHRTVMGLQEDRKLRILFIHAVSDS